MGGTNSSSGANGGIMIFNRRTYVFKKLVVGMGQRFVGSR